MMDSYQHHHFRRLENRAVVSVRPMSRLLRCVRDYGEISFYAPNADAAACLFGWGEAAQQRKPATRRLGARGWTGFRVGFAAASAAGHQCGPTRPEPSSHPAGVGGACLVRSHSLSMSHFTSSSALSICGVEVLAASSRRWPDGSRKVDRLEDGVVGGANHPMPSASILP